MAKILSPLADRMRPKGLDEILGQDHILGKDKILHHAIEEDSLFSFVLWGPPGSGKTSIARIIAGRTSASFVEYSAVTSGIPEVRKAIENARLCQKMYQQKTILFIDEIHRFNKAQQDAFLPCVEDGTVILIGATTENPYFEMTSPLRSRMKIYKLNSLSIENLGVILDRVLKDTENGLGMEKIEISKEAREFLLNSAEGDARILLNSLEVSLQGKLKIEEGKKILDLDALINTLSEKPILYDKKGESHYDTISAFIKSLRGGDPNAALYWLARMLASGEDPRFIARRMVIAAAEDVGNADPWALLLANAAAHAVEYVGMPEARIPLAEAAVHIASAPKSNSAYKGIEKALSDTKNKLLGPVPLHLRNPAFQGAKELNYGKGYKYAHDFQGHFVKQQYLPDNLADEVYYEPSGEGFEAKIRERLKERFPEKYNYSAKKDNY